MQYFLVFIGSGFGGILRLLLYRCQTWLGISFPIATLICNLIGSVAIVLLFSIVKDVNLKAFIFTGLLGGFTTYSMFTLDISTTPYALLYIILNICIISLCVVIFRIMS